MLADFFTKPMQGGLFKKLRDQSMGITTIPIEERVVICAKDHGTNKEMAIGIEDKGENNQRGKRMQKQLERAFWYIRKTST